MCDNNTECSIDGVARICYREPDFSSDSYFCDCSSWFGFVGDDCDETSPTLYYYRTSTIFFSIIFFILIVFTTRTLVLYVRLYKRREKTGDKIDPVFYLLLLVLLAAILLLTQAVIRIPSLFDASLYIVDIQKSLFFEDQDEVLAVTGKAGAQLLIAGSCVIFLAEIQIILSWLKLLITFSQTFPESYGCIPVERLAQIMKYVLPFLLVCVALLVSIESFSETALFYMLIVVVLTIGYAYGYYKFVRILKRLPKGDTGKRKAINLVKTSYQITLVGNFGVFILSALYYYFLLDYINQIGPGDFNYILVIYDLAILSGTLLLANLSWYSHVVTVRLLKIEKNSPWVPKLSFKTSMRSISKSKITKQSEDKLSKDGEPVPYIADSI